MSKNIFRFALNSIMVIAIISLGNCKKPNTQSARNIPDSLPAYISSIDTQVDMIYSMPDPEEILNEIFVEDIVFKSGIVCSIDNANQIFKYNSIALYMGVLMSDMTYLMIQEKNNLSIEYYRTVIKLSDQLDLSFFRNSDLLEKIEANVDDKDALLVVFKESLGDIKYELDYSKRNKTMALIYTGSIIETLYLAISNIENNNAQMISEHILEQYSIFNSLKEFLSYYSSNSDIRPIIEQLDSIEYYMNVCIAHDTIVAVEKTKDNILHFRGNKAIYNLDSFDSVRNKIFELRNNIIEN